MIRFLIASPHSGAGKTVITLAIMRLLRKRAVKYQPAKSGPDYIDPKFLLIFLNLFIILLKSLPVKSGHNFFSKNISV